MNKKVTLLFLSWRDIKAPKMGGAEIYTHEMISRADRSKFNIIHFSPFFEGAKEEEVIDGVRYIREGSILSVIKCAKRYYKKNRDSIDYVVNQCNTHQFFTPFWVEKSKRIFFIHQLTREIWFYHANFPLNIAGYTLEPLLLRLNSRDRAITVSNSTREDLLRLGFKSHPVEVIPEGLNFIPWEGGDKLIKEDDLTLIYVGRFAKYKGIEDSIIAFSRIIPRFPKSKMWIVGKPDKEYLKKRIIPLCKKCNLLYEGDQANIILKGFVTEEEKLSLMSRAHLLIFPSVREGWGLTISEAAAVGTPSLVYDAPGTRDAVLNGDAGYMVPVGDIDALKEKIESVVDNSELYNDIRTRAFEFAKELHWDNTGMVFNSYLKKILGEDNG